MKDLANIIEGLLGGDLNDAIETGVYDNRITKLIDKWRSKSSDFGTKTDRFGNELNVGDYVMWSQDEFIEFGQIVKTNWSSRQQLMVKQGSFSHEYEVYAEDVIKLEPKQIFNILKELCGH